MWVPRAVGKRAQSREAGNPKNPLSWSRLEAEWGCAGLTLWLHLLTGKALVTHGALTLAAGTLKDGLPIVEAGPTAAGVEFHQGRLLHLVPLTGLWRAGPGPHWSPGYFTVSPVLLSCTLQLIVYIIRNGIADSKLCIFQWFETHCETLARMPF